MGEQAVEKRKGQCVQSRQRVQSNQVKEECRGGAATRKRSSRGRASNTPVRDGAGESEGLPTLTRKQQALVADNLGLIGVHLRTRVPTPAMPRREREYDDLFQEGAVALSRAAARYDPDRHGAFAAFALPRIRGAVFAAIHDRFSLIRLPAHIVQNRAKRPSKNRPGAKSSQADTDSVAIENARGALVHHRSPSTTTQPFIEDYTMDADFVQQDQPFGFTGGETIRHVIRQRFERAVWMTMDQMRKRCWRRRDPTAIMDQLARERLLINTAAERTPLRQIAKDHSVSSGRVSSYELQLTDAVRECFAQDVQLPLLLGWLKDEPAGVDAVLDCKQLDALDQVECDVFMDAFGQGSREDQARTVYELIERVERSGDGVDQVVRNLFRMTYREEALR